MGLDTVHVVYRGWEVWRVGWAGRLAVAKKREHDCFVVLKGAICVRQGAIDSASKASMYDGDFGFIRVQYLVCNLNTGQCCSIVEREVLQCEVLNWFRWLRCHDVKV